MSVLRFTLLLMMFTSLGGVPAMAETPEPSFKALLTDGVFEVRHYTPQLAADVTLVGEDVGSSDAFRVLADYIFKEYPTGAIGMTAPVTIQRGEAIGMTVPVTVAAGKDRQYMRFYLPERYTLATLPKPLDARISILEIPARTVATIRYSGWNTATKVAEQNDKLRAWMADKGLQAVGPAEVQGFNAPWVLPWWRRNEVWVPVKADKV